MTSTCVSTTIQRMPTLAPPEYLTAVAKASSDIDIKFYLSELGLTSHLKRISPENEATRNTPVTFTDPPLVRSEAWSNFDFTKSSKKRR